ncbi:putative GH25 family protein [Luteibacter sp. 1214]|nr:putative GH25 family protein [Luteibacter sp. 1214]
MMKHAFVRAALGAALALALPMAAQAHKMWMVPSATVVSGDDAWVTVDAAVSNELYYPDHFPAQLDQLVITAPDGSTVQAENENKGKYRSTFDLAVPQKGTYRIALVNQGVFATYELDGQKKRWRGAAADLKTGLPANAKNVEVNEMASRVETFVTQGSPSTGALKPTGKGMELVPVTAPNDLVSGEKATFQLLVDGKPAADVKVVAIDGGTRYRNAQDEMDTTTDKDGKFSFTWPAAGMYWVNASAEDKKTSTKEAKQRRLGYTATLEVLPQ